MGAGEMDQLKEFAALAEDLGSVLSTHVGPLTTSFNSCSRRSKASVHQHLYSNTYTHTDTYTEHN